MFVDARKRRQSKLVVDADLKGLRIEFFYTCKKKEEKNKERDLKKKRKALQKQG